MNENIAAPTPKQLYLLLLLAENSRNPDKASKLVLSIKLIDYWNGCWFLSDDWSIYPVIQRERGNRVSYEVFIGNCYKGLEICHHCDRPGCVNPWHLFQGTHSDNMNDAIKKGRAFRIHITPSKHKYTASKLIEAKKIITHYGELFGSARELKNITERMK